jgi:alpha-mannosidase
MMIDEESPTDKTIQIAVWHAPGTSRPTFDEAMKGEYEEARLGDQFGPSWSTHWFRLDITLPDFMKKYPLLELVWDANNEGLIWTDDGHPVQGLTGGGERSEWILPKDFRDGKKHRIYIEMACNGMFGNAPGGDSIQPPDPNKTFMLYECKVVAVNPDARELYTDMWIISDAAREFPDDSWEKHKALDVANRVIDTFRLGDKDSLKECRKIAQEYLGPLSDSHKVYDSGKEPLVFAVGHCHIDSCWLWPFAETKRKVARSWSNQCDLMDRYPELTFVASQAQQYKWLKELYPYVFDRVKQKVKEGRFHPIGGSWVEHDTNMPSGESLVRQFLYGQRFFQSNFGERSTTFWLPDTFGYSSQIPQICRIAGMNRFLTQKLSWNNINNFPHTTFNWVALDGSQVLCHMPPSETYTADAHFGDVKRSVTQHKSLDQDNTSLLVFGKGDGGGGPTWQQIDKLRRCRGLADTTGLLPRVQMGVSVDEYYDKIEAKANNLCTWDGELYFELHRGTYTTQARNKLNNRKGEVLMRDVEYLATMASLQDKEYKYPKKDIDDMWENILLCQFHDCLPGSSIRLAYDESDEFYAEVYRKGKNILQEACKSLGVAEPSFNRGADDIGTTTYLHDASSPRARSNTKTFTLQNAMVLNTLPWARKSLVQISDTEAGIACGTGHLLQLRPVKTDEAHGGVSVRETSKGVFVLSNRDLRVTLENGVIKSLHDVRNQREVIPEGKAANQYVLFDDKPLYWQAWDVEVYHLDTRKELAGSVSIITEDKGYRASVSNTTRITERSYVETTISLPAAVAGRPSQVEVSAKVYWHEKMKFLKVEFPVDVRNTEASYDTAFGVVKRPTHYNTDWDMAKFEVCCHKYADLSEHDYGVSILNDSKYGFATAGNVMRLSLLRSPKAPDDQADMGVHHIRWAIMPHAGSLGHETVRAAYEFNSPLKVVLPTGDVDLAATSSHPLKLSGDKNLVLDTVKRGEDDEDVSRGELPVRKGQSVILRIFESLGGRGRGTVETTWNVKKAFKCNALEDDLEEIKLLEGGKGFAVELRAFEIGTYRLQL